MAKSGLPDPVSWLHVDTLEDKRDGQLGDMSIREPHPGDAGLPRLRTIGREQAGAEQSVPLTIRLLP